MRRNAVRSRSRQVINFYSHVEGAAEGRLLVRANQMLPPDIRVMRIAAAPPDFVARYSNTGACLSPTGMLAMMLGASCSGAAAPHCGSEGVLGAMGVMWQPDSQ